MTSEELWNNWVRRLKNFVENEILSKGHVNLACHLHPNKYKSIGDRVKNDFLKNDPAPPNPKKRLKKPIPPTPPVVQPPHGPSVHGTGNMNKQIKQAQTFYHPPRFRGGGGRGGSSLLSTLVLLGTGTGAAAATWKLGVIVMRWYVEEKIWEAAERNFINPVLEAVDYARMPATKMEVHYWYMQYCSFAIGSVANKGGTPQLMSEDDYCWLEYGILLSVLPD